MPSKVKLDHIVFNEALDGISAIVNLRQLYKKRYQVPQLRVSRIIVPGDDGDSLLRHEHVCGRGVVQDDGVLGAAADLRHILGEHPVHVGAVLSEEPHGTVSVGVHQIHKWISILRETRRENDHLIVLGHDLKEVVDAGSLLDVDVARRALYLNWDDEVGVAYLVELTMHQRLIQVEHERLPSL